MTPSEKKRPSVSKKRRVASPAERASSSSAPASVLAPADEPAIASAGEFAASSALGIATSAPEPAASAFGSVDAGAVSASEAHEFASDSLSAKSASSSSSTKPAKSAKSVKPAKRPAVSQREKKKAAKAKIVVPAAKPKASSVPDEGNVGERGFGGAGFDDAGLAEESFGEGYFGEAAFDESSAFPPSEGAFLDEDEAREFPSESRPLKGKTVSRGKKEASEGKRRSVKKRRMWPKVVAAVVLVLMAVVVGAFSWNRWLKADDTMDFLGTWYVPGGTTPVSVEGGSIVLAEDVAYSYVLDTDSKTINFTFGQMKGQGYYHFSLDRQTLTIQDGAYSWMDTLAQDIAWTVDELKAVVSRDEAPVPSGEGIIVLKRAPSQAEDAPLNAESVGEEGLPESSDPLAEGAEGADEKAGVAIEGAAGEGAGDGAAGTTGAGAQ